MKRISCLEAAVVVLVLLLSLASRLTSLSAFRVADEMRWMCRIIGFRDALARGDWANTYLIGHPGVVTTWLGVISTPSESAEVRVMCHTSLDGRRLERIAGSQEERNQLLVALNELLIRARVGVAVFSWICIAATYVLARLMWGPRIAVPGLIMVALDPFYLAMSRFLHLDAVLASAMILSVLSLLVSLDRSRSRRWQVAYLVLSAVMGGVSILQKSPAMFLGPFVALVQGANAVREGVRWDRLLRAAGAVLIWGLVAVVVYVVLWPAMWVDPVGTMQQVLFTALGYAESGHLPGNYFLGRPVHDPGWLFYPVTLAFRLSPLALPGLVLGVVWVAKERGDAKARFEIGVLLAYGALFGAFMSLGSKKFDRYVLPVFPALDIVATVGLVWAVKFVCERFRLRGLLQSRWVAYGALAAVQIAVMALHYPYYLTYYNPLLGGIRQAEEVLLVGWGEGYEEAAAYLNAKPDAEHLQVTVPTFPVFAPQFRGDTRRVQEYCVWDSEYVVFYLSYVQRQRFEELLAEYMYNPEVEPEHVVTLHGVDFAWLYRNDQHYLEPMAYIEEQSRPDEGECLLVNGGSLFAQNYGGQLPTYEFFAEWVPEKETYAYWSAERTAEVVDDMSLECERVWYVRYPEWEQGTYLDLLDVRGTQLQRAVFSHIEVTQYQLGGTEVATLPLDLQFGGLRLKGYGVTEPPAAWGRDGGVVLEWEALEELEDDYAVFLHLYDARGERIAQGDALLVDEALRPTAQWEAGVSNVVLYHLPIGPGTPPGEYELELGVYSQKTGSRLRLGGTEGETAARLKVEVGASEMTPTVEQLGVLHVIGREALPELELVGFGVDQEAVLAGQTVALRVYWETQAEMETAYRLAVNLRDAGGKVYNGGEYDLVNTGYPTTEWRAGEALRGVYDVAVSEEAPTGEMTVEVNLLEEGEGAVLAEPIVLGSVWVQSTRQTFDVPEMEERSGALLGDTVKLLGYDLDQGPVNPGGNIHVTLYWQGLQEMEKSYKVFVHVYDGENIVAQRDWLPGLGLKPTAGWALGEVVADRHIVPVAEGLAAGKYEVAVGLYEEGSGERLAVSGPDGERLSQDRILLGWVEVGP